MRARRQQPERQVQKAVKELFERVGGKVWVLGTTRRKGEHPGTMQTPGLPDLWVVLPSTVKFIGGCGFWFECKADKGRLTLAQLEFQIACRLAHVNHLWGGLDDAIAFLKRGGWLK